MYYTGSGSRTRTLHWCYKWIKAKKLQEEEEEDEGEEEGKEVKNKELKGVEKGK